MVARPYKREQSRSHRRRSDVGCHGAAPGKQSPLLQFLEFLGNREDKRHWNIKLVLELGRTGQNPGRGTVARDISTVRHTAWEGRGGGSRVHAHRMYRQAGRLRSWPGFTPQAQRYRRAHTLSVEHVSNKNGGSTPILYAYMHHVYYKVALKGTPTQNLPYLCRAGQ